MDQHPHRDHDQRFGILMYHRVAAHVAGAPRPTWNVTPQRFRRQIEGLLSHGYEPWSLRRLLDCRGSGRPIPPRVFAVTFDDGYECVYREAWPILKELSVPATIFVVTSCLDSESRFISDNWAVAGSPDVPAAAWRPLRTSQCEEMLAEGLVDVGSHTHAHADLCGRPGMFRRDLERSLRLLRERLGVERPSFAFPFGRHDAGLMDAARQAGVQCALTTEPRPAPLGSDPFGWGRFTVREHDTAATLRFKLSGWYTAMRSVWTWLRPVRYADPASRGTDVLNVSRPAKRTALSRRGEVS